MGKSPHRSYTQLLNNMKKRKAAGPDSMDMELLKYLEEDNHGAMQANTEHMVGTR